MLEVGALVAGGLQPQGGELLGHVAGRRRAAGGARFPPVVSRTGQLPHVRQRGLAVEGQGVLRPLRRHVPAGRRLMPGRLELGQRRVQRGRESHVQCLTLRQQTHQLVQRCLAVGGDEVAHGVAHRAVDQVGLARCKLIEGRQIGQRRQLAVLGRFLHLGEPPRRQVAALRGDPRHLHLGNALAQPVHRQSRQCQQVVSERLRQPPAVVGGVAVPVGQDLDGLTRLRPTAHVVGQGEGDGRAEGRGLVVELNFGRSRGHDRQIARLAGVDLLQVGQESRRQCGQA